MSEPSTPGSPTPAQIAQMQQAMAAEARKRGMTPQQFQAQQRAQLEAGARAEGMTLEEYVNKLRNEAMENHKRQLQSQRSGQSAGSDLESPPNSPDMVPIENNGEVDPQALALAKWLRTQDLKTRTCILNGQRRDMFRVKRAIRAINSPAYAKAAANPKAGLPPVTDSMTAADILKLLPLSFLALRVSKVDPHEGHGHGPTPKSKKRVKGLWTVRVEPQQDISPNLHYAFLYEGSQWKTKLYAVGALVGVFAVILFPLWPLFLRKGVWYLSMAMLGVIALFFAMALFRLILFVITLFAVPPGLWLYPNLFEDVGFFDSFRPLWGWQETAEDKKAAKKAKREARAARRARNASKSRSRSRSQHQRTSRRSPLDDDDSDAASHDDLLPINNAEDDAPSDTAETSAVDEVAPGLLRRGLHARVDEADDTDSD